MKHEEGTFTFETMGLKPSSDALRPAVQLTVGDREVLVVLTQKGIGALLRGTQ
jgi:hypothetical protein